MPDKDNLDLLIDAAIDTYANVAASDRLEEQMLQGVRRHIADQSARRHLRWSAWSAALAAAACVLTFALFSPRPEVTPAKNAQKAGVQNHPRGKAAEVPSIPPPPADIRSAQRTAKTVRVLAIPPISAPPAKAPPLPKLDVFPTPAPPDEQAEALAFFIRVAPPGEVKQLLEAQARADAPLAVKQLEIPPLQPLDEGGK